MTIKEIEERTGLARANVRFYEAQGLLSPARGENGYRDYSGEDVSALLRIKLLRCLGISIEEIKALISGDALLPELLSARRDALAQKRAEIGRAEELCELLLGDGAEFATLDAPRYLHFYESSGTRSEAFKSDTLPRAAHPFRRYFARALDEAVYMLVIYAVLTVFRVNTERIGGLWDGLQVGGIIPTLLLLWLRLIVMVLPTLLFEPVLLRFFGTTPGKWIMGMYITAPDGEKPDYGTAARRCWGMLFRGYGLLIPIYMLYRLWKSMMACLDCEELPWEDETVLMLRDTRGARIAALFAARLAVAVVAALLPQLGSIPKNVGELTPAEFAENYNALNRFYDLSGEVMTASGELVEPGGAVIYILGEPADPPALDFAVGADGHITSVTMSLRADSVGYQGHRVCLAALSLVRARPAALLGTPKLAELRSFIDENPYEDFTYSICGVELTCDYTLSGFEAHPAFGFYQPVEGEEQVFEFTFTMRAGE